MGRSAAPRRPAARAVPAARSGGCPGEAERDRRCLLALSEVVDALAAGQDSGAILQRVVDGACELLGGSSASLDLLERAGPADVWTRTVVAVAGDPQFPVGTSRSVADGIGSYVLETGQPVLVRHRSAKQVEPRAVAERARADRAVESAVGVALTVRGDVRGVLGVYHTEPDRFSAADVDVLARFAAPAGLVVEDARDRESDRLESERLRTLPEVLEQTGAGVALASLEGVVTYCNPAFAALHGYSAATATGRPVNDFCPPGRFRGADLPAQQGKPGEVEMETVRQHADGRDIPVALQARTMTGVSGELTGWITAVHDISRTQALEAELSSRALRDPLTGLGNRALLDVELPKLLTSAAATGCRMALLMIDLDRFKSVNDSLGHPVGDALLVQVARRFADRVRAGTVLLRMGGDEFVALLPQVVDELDAVATARRLLAAMTEPFRLGDREVVVSASVGVVTSAAGRDDPTSLLRSADIALYRAKAAGRNRYAVFDPADSARSLARLDLEAELRSGIPAGQLRLARQPVVDLASGRLEGHEALVRWAHPARGMLAPAGFLDVAADSGLIWQLGGWMLRRACAATVADGPRSHHAIGVNVSAAQLADPRFPILVEQVLTEVGLAARRLILEVTETLVMRPESAQVLDDLRTIGVRLAIDDFGTGYSSLAYLKTLPVSLIKLDQAFVAGLGVDPRDDAIAQAVLTLASTLGLDVVAEGIEHPGQLDTLRRLGAKFGQGFLLGRPEVYVPRVCRPRAPAALVRPERTTETRRSTLG